MIFITGTDTDIGKTTIASWLCLKTGYTYWKPIQTGAIIGENSSDTSTIQKYGIETIAEQYCFAEPSAPAQASSKENIEISIDAIEVPNIPCIVEGAGGIFVPINKDALMIDLIQKMNIPVIIVSGTQLGTINHTLLTIHVLQERNIPILGVILNNVDKGRSPLLNPPVLNNIDKGYSPLWSVPVLNNVDKGRSPLLNPPVLNNIDKGCSPLWSIPVLNNIDKGRSPLWSIPVLNNVDKGHFPLWSVPVLNNIDKGCSPLWSIPVLNNIDKGRSPLWSVHYSARQINGIPTLISNFVEDNSLKNIIEHYGKVNVLMQFPCLKENTLAELLAIPLPEELQILL